MVYLIIFVVLIIIIFKLAWDKAGKEIEEEDNKKGEHPSDLVDKNEVLNTVNTINTLEDFKKLQTKFNRKEASISAHSTNSTLIKYETLSEAYYEAYDKVYMFQYDPFLSIDSTRKEIDNYRKLFSIEEFEKEKKELMNEENFTEITFGDFVEKNYEKKPAFLNKLLSYKDIMENTEIKLEEKAQKVLELCKNKAFREEFFFDESLKEIKEGILMSELFSLKVPLPLKLYEAGIKTKKDLMKCDIMKVKQIPGFGPKKIEQLELIIKTMHNTI